jgi:hypothetical protein
MQIHKIIKPTPTCFAAHEQQGALLISITAVLRQHAQQALPRRACQIRPAAERHTQGARPWQMTQ